jgi:hypothetical protein
VVLSKAARWPGIRSEATNLNGPEPTASLICSKASVLASRSGMIEQWGSARASGKSGNGFLRRNRIVLSETAASSSVRSISA